ncbi:predicted oxidoreductase [Longilinea arvoryzae]|uniref:Predicted oxidoreductase n=1 Tax=Longilinea arvoryzae TaxID=360412 RepID=A0A0S7BD32_9CHLR|nr:aldo/keto reductase [Longilinea arvoryzae]GAP15804.1 predicted oxidoreductase [Longilinea arvoryzae]
MESSIPNPAQTDVPFVIDDFHKMPYRRLGQSGLRVSNVGLGTWKFGYPETGDGARVDEKTAFEIFDRAIELGVTFWDTANRYNFGSGNSERLIGKWLANNPDQRRNIVLATKIFGGMDGYTPNHCRLGRINILESVYACLDRLQSDSIDLLYFHSYEPDTPPEESLSAIEDLVRQDLIRHFAVSNFTVDQLQLYQSLESSFSIRCRVVAVQNQYDILNFETGQPGVLEHCRQSGVSFVAFSPLARGLLTSRYLNKTKIGPGDRLFDEGTLDKDLTPQAYQRLVQLAAVATELGLEVNQLALAYMLTLPGMGPVIPASSTVQQLESNAAAGRFVLTAEQRERINAIIVPEKP